MKKTEEIKELKELFSDVTDEAVTLSERHRREIAVLENREARGADERTAASACCSQKRRIKRRRGAIGAVAAAAVCVLALTPALGRLGKTDGGKNEIELPSQTNSGTQGSKTDGGKNEVELPPQINSGTHGSDELRFLGAESYEEEALVTTVVRYMDENARGGAARAASVKFSGVNMNAQATGGGIRACAAGNSVYFYPFKSVTFLRGYEFSVSTQTDSFLTEKCGKGDLRIIVADFNSEEISEETLFCAIGSEGSYFCLKNSGSYEYLPAGVEADYQAGPEGAIKTQTNFSGHKRIANGMIIKDFSHESEGADVEVRWTEKGIFCSLSTYQKDGKSGAEEYTVEADSYKQADVSRMFDLSAYVEEYLVVRLTEAPVVETAPSENGGESEEIVIGYTLFAVYGILDKNETYYEVPCKIQASVGADWSEADAESLSEGTLLKVYFSELSDVYGDEGTYLSLVATKLSVAG